MGATAVMIQSYVRVDCAIFTDWQGLMEDFRVNIGGRVKIAFIDASWACVNDELCAWIEQKGCDVWLMQSTQEMLAASSPQKQAIKGSKMIARPPSRETLRNILAK